jgi:hypothetical protein
MPAVQEAWLVVVDLNAVARRLYARCGRTRCELDAIAEVSGKNMETGKPSPLIATQELGTYYTETDPMQTRRLQPNEVIYVRRTPPTKRPWDIGADET